MSSHSPVCLSDHFHVWLFVCLSGYSSVYLSDRFHVWLFVCPCLAIRLFLSVSVPPAVSLPVIMAVPSSTTRTFLYAFKIPPSVCLALSIVRLSVRMLFMLFLFSVCPQNLCVCLQSPVQLPFWSHCPFLWVTLSFSLGHTVLFSGTL